MVSRCVKRRRLDRERSLACQMSSLSFSRGGGRSCRATNSLVYWPALPKVANIHPVEHDPQYCYCGLVGSEKNHSQRLPLPEYLAKAGQAPTYLPTH